MSGKTKSALEALPVMVEVEQGGEFGSRHMLALDISPSNDDSSETNEPVVDSTEEMSAVGAETVENREEASEPSATEPMVIRYIGEADVYQHPEFNFRRGEPVEVPGAIAVELLANLQERFEEVKE